MCKQSTMFGQTWASKHLPGYYAGTNVTQTDVVCFDWKTNLWSFQAYCNGDMRKDWQQQKTQTTMKIVHFPREGHIFFQKC